MARLSDDFFWGHETLVVGLDNWWRGGQRGRVTKRLEERVLSPCCGAASAAEGDNFSVFS
jgi:hypothetical protein